MNDKSRLIKRVLIIKFWALGDIIMATPMLNAIKAEPSTYIAWLVDSKHADVLLNHPLLDDVIIIDTGFLRSSLKKRKFGAWWSTVRSIVSKIKAQHFDAVINCHPDKLWTYLFCLAPNRVALYSSMPNSLAKLFFTQSVARTLANSIHNTNHYLLATQALGFERNSLQMTIGQSIDAASFFEGILREQGIAVDQKIIVLAPYSTADNKDWPEANYKKLALWLIESYNAFVIVTTGPGRADQARAAFQTVSKNSLIITHDTTVAQFVAIMRGASLVVSGDSSPMHIAAAVNVPFIALFGPTKMHELLPLCGAGRAVRIPLDCSPCDSYHCKNTEFRKCMTSIELVVVQNAVRKLFDNADADSKVQRLLRI